MFYGWLIAYLMAGVLALLASYLTWRQRNAPGALYLALFLLSVGLYFLVVSLEGVIPQWSIKLFCLKLEYSFISLMGPTFVLFTIQYTRRRYKYQNLIYSLLFLPLVLSLILIWTNELHHLVWTHLYLATPIPVLRPTYGPWFWIQTSHSSALGLIAIGVLAPEIPKIRRPLRWAFALFLFGLLITLWGIALYITHQLSFNPAPVTTAVVLALIIYMLRYAGMFDVIPIARSTLVDNIAQGLLTLDRNGLILDVNPAAHRLLCSYSCQLLRRPVTDVLGEWPRILAAVQSHTHHNEEIVIQHPDQEPHYIEVQVIPLRYNQYPIGTLVILNDVTSYKKLQSSLQQALEKERASRRYAQTLSEITLSLTSRLSTEHLFRQLLIQVEKLVPYDSANIAILENGVLRIVQWRGYEKFGPTDFLEHLRQSLDAFPLAKRALESGSPLLVEDTRQTPEWIFVPETRWIRSNLNLPIRHQGRPLGTLRLDSAKPRAFTQEDVRKLKPLTNIIAIALANAKLHEQLQEELKQRKEAEKALQRQLRHLQALFEFTEALGALLDIDEVCRVISTHVHAFLECECVGVYIETSPHLWHLKAHTPCATLTFPDTATEEELDHVRTEQGVTSLLIKGAPRARLILRREHPLTGEEHDFLTAIVSQAGLALSRAQAYNQLKEAERKYRELFHNIPVGLYRLSPEGYLLHANTALARILHFPDLPTLLETPYSHLLVHENAYLAWREQLENAEGPVIVELNMRCYDGQTIWARHTSHVVRDDEGHILYIDGFLEDITEDVHLRKERQRFITRIQQQAEQMKALNEILLDITQEHDVQKLLLKITQKAVELLGGTGGGIYLTAADKKEMVCVVSYNTPEDYTGITLRLGEGAAGLVAATAAPLIIPDYRVWPNRAQVYEETKPFVSVISVPMIWREEVLGVIEVLHHQPNYFSLDHQNLLMLFARQAAVALQNARLLEQERKRQAELEALRQASLKVTSSLELPEILETLLESTMSLVPADDAHIFLYDGKELTFGAAYWGGQTRDHPYALPRKEGVTYRVARTGEPIIIPNVNEHPLYQNWKWGGAMASFPLKTATRVVGVMNVAFLKPHKFTEDEIHLLKLFADQAAIAIEHAELFAEKERHTRNITVLQRILQVLNASPSLDEAFPQLSHLLKEFTGAARVSLALLSEDGESFTISAVDAEQGPTEAPLKMPLHACAASDDVLAGRVHITLDLEKEAKMPGERRLLQAGYRSRVNVPLHLKGRILGSLNLSWTTPLTRPPAFIPVLKQIADALALAVERAQLLRSSQRQAEELASLYKTALVLGSTLDSHELWRKVYEEVNKIMHPTSMGIFLYDEDRERVEIALMMREDQVVTEALGARYKVHACGLTGWVIRNVQSLLIEDIYQDPLPVSVCEMEERGHAYLGVPLYVGDRVLGAIALQAMQPGAFSEADKRFLEALAAQVAIAAANARAYEAERRAREESEHLLEAAQALSSTLDLQDVFDRILTELQKVVPYDSASVQELRGDELVIIGGRGFPNLEEIVGLRFHVREGENPNQHVVRKRGPVIYDDVTLYFEEFRKEPHAQANIHSWLGVPMLYGDRLIGIITLDKQEVAFYTAEHARIAQAFAAQAAIAIENARLYQHIQTQAERVQRILDTMPDGVYLLDREKRILMANTAGRSFLDALGVSLSEPLTRLGDRPIEEILRRPALGIRHEIHGVTERRRIFEAVAQPLGEDQLQGWVLVVRDVTQEREIQQRIQQQDRLAAIGQLAAGIAHDFNNILQGIIGFARLLSRREDLPEDVRRRLRLIANQGERGAQLVHQILDFSRRSIPHRRLLSLDTLVKETLYWFKESLPENIELHVDISPGTYPIHADATQIQQVLTNLILNARDAMPEGGILWVRLDRVRYRAVDELPIPELRVGEWIRLRVSDTGVGIPEDILSHIFEPFFTTKGQNQGTGLGLAQVYGIVQQHEGYITVESEVGRGTTFTIYFPPFEPPGGEVESAGGKSRAGKYILVLHPDPTFHAELEYIVQEHDIHILRAQEPEEALRLFRHHRGEIVALLVELGSTSPRSAVPGGNGYYLEGLPTIIVADATLLRKAYSLNPHALWIRKERLKVDLPAVLQRLVETAVEGYAD